LQQHHTRPRTPGVVWVVRLPHPPGSVPDWVDDVILDRMIYEVMTARSPYRIRRIRRHLWLVALSGIMLALFWVVLPYPGAIARLSFGSAYTGLALLAASLILGPINVVRKRPNPVSFDLRRDVGIWAGIVGLFHVVVGLQAHLGGEFWRYFLYRLPSRGDPLPIRFDLFGLANHTGLAATLVLVLLLALSNDLALRRLRSRRWKSLQRWNYAAFGFVALHGAGYQLNSGRPPGLVALFLAMVAAVVIIQFAGYRARASERGT
jgi:methionine sulfoxide reductase heme-binding subunit